MAVGNRVRILGQGFLGAVSSTGGGQRRIRAGPGLLRTSVHAVRGVRLADGVRLPGSYGGFLGDCRRSSFG